MVDPKTVIRHLDELRTLTADDQGAQRLAWSPTWLKARAWFEEKIKDLLGRAEFVKKELEAMYMLKKYRAMKQRYYEEPNKES